MLIRLIEKASWNTIKHKKGGIFQRKVPSFIRQSTLLLQK